MSSRLDIHFLMNRPMFLRLLLFSYAKPTSGLKSYMINACWKKSLTKLGLSDIWWFISTRPKMALQFRIDDLSNRIESFITGNSFNLMFRTSQPERHTVDMKSHSLRFSWIVRVELDVWIANPGSMQIIPLESLYLYRRFRLRDCKPLVTVVEPSLT